MLSVCSLFNIMQQDSCLHFFHIKAVRSLCVRNKLHEHFFSYFNQVIFEVKFLRQSHAYTFNGGPSSPQLHSTGESDSSAPVLLCHNIITVITMNIVIYLVLYVGLSGAQVVSRVSYLIQPKYFFVRTHRIYFFIMNYDKIMYLVLLL